MQMTQTITGLLPAQNQPSVQLSLEPRLVSSNEQPELQPLFGRLRIIYFQYLDLNDELSLKIQEIAEKFILTDCSKMNQFKEVIRIAQDCKKQFAKILCNDLDQAPLEKPVVIRNWTFEEWQLYDFIKLDKFFGQRQAAISPFDQLPFPEELPRHEFAQAIIQLLNTIPELPQETVFSSPAAQQEALVTNQASSQLIIFPPQGNNSGQVNRQEAENYSPQTNLLVAWQRYNMWKRLARASLQERKCSVISIQLEVDIAARKRRNENYLQEIINQEAQWVQRALAEVEEREQAMQTQLEGARVEIAKLTTQLDETTANLKKLRDEQAVQAKRSEDLQRQIYAEQAKYIRLAQQVQDLRNRCKKRPWWKFW